MEESSSFVASASRALAQTVNVLGTVGVLDFVSAPAAFWVARGAKSLKILPIPSIHAEPAVLVSRAAH